MKTKSQTLREMAARAELHGLPVMALLLRNEAFLIEQSDKEIEQFSKRNNSKTGDANAAA